MVRLHVVDYQVIHLAVADQRRDMVEIVVDELPFDGVDEGDFFIDDEVGIVADSVGNGPNIFKKMGSPVVETHKPDVAGKSDL